MAVYELAAVGLPSGTIPSHQSIGRDHNDSCFRSNETTAAAARSYFSTLMNEYKDILSDSKTYQIMSLTIGSAVAVWIIRKRRAEQQLLSAILIPADSMKSTNSSNSGDRTIAYTARIRTMKGRIVFLKSILLPQSSPLTKKTKHFLCQLFELRDENLCTFYGVLNTSDLLAPERILVWEYCAHGSLSQVLQDQDVCMDWNFRLSLLMDIARVRLRCVLN